MTTNVVECKDCAYGREANVPNAVFCMLNHQTFSIPVYGCANGRPGRIVPQTNADRIRAMSDEELARFIAGQRGWYCDFKDPEEEEYPKALDWLKAPLEGGEG